MNDQPEETVSFWQHHRFIVLIAGTIVISIVLVGISLFIYKTSGAAQLDLSRPGYISVSKEATNNDTKFTNYSETGPVNKDSIDQFKKLYDAQAQSATSVDAFGGDPLNAATLEFAQAGSQQ